MADEAKNTALGLLRRTGPASAELLDPETGAVYKFDFAQAVDRWTVGPMDGREMADGIFGEDRKSVV